MSNVDLKGLLIMVWLKELLIINWKFNRRRYFFHLHGKNTTLKSNMVSLLNRDLCSTLTFATIWMTMEVAISSQI